MVPLISKYKIVHTLKRFHLAMEVNAYDGFRIVDSLHKSKYHISTVAEYSHCSCSRDPASQSVENGGAENVLKEKHAMSSKQGTVKMLGDGHKVTVLSVQSKPSSSHTCSQNPGYKEAMSSPSQDSRESDCRHACERHIYQPILPWINGDGSMNSTVYEGLTRRIIGYVMQYPGIVEEDVIHQMEVLNPQTCRTLLEKLTLDRRHLYVRVSEEPVPAAPTILQCLFSQGSSTEPSKRRRRYFANPASTFML